MKKLKQYIMALVMQKEQPNSTQSLRLLLFCVNATNLDEAKGAALRLAHVEIKTLFNEEGYSLMMCNAAHIEASVQ